MLRQCRISLSFGPVTVSPKSLASFTTKMLIPKTMTSCSFSKGGVLDSLELLKSSCWHLVGFICILQWEHQDSSESIASEWVCSLPWKWTCKHTKRQDHKQTVIWAWCERYINYNDVKKEWWSYRTLWHASMELDLPRYTITNSHSNGSPVGRQRSCLAAPSETVWTGVHHAIRSQRPSPHLEVWLHLSMHVTCQFVVAVESEKIFIGLLPRKVSWQGMLRWGWISDQKRPGNTFFKQFANT